MNSSASQILALEEKVNAMLAGDTGAFLVEVRIKPQNNVKVFIDADEGISIDRLSQYNRTLYKQIESSGFFGGADFSLEVSSPGLDEPLKLHRQYLKNIGRPVEVLLNDGTMKEGKLIEATGSGIMIEETTGTRKKPETKRHQFGYDDIKTTKIQIKF
ncbi:MAG TPA: ribosome maturation factor [Chitinophagaceae bacterium]|jgi:ribosome maturation factor RimP